MVVLLSYGNKLTPTALFLGPVVYAPFLTAIKQLQHCTLIVAVKLFIF